MVPFVRHTLQNLLVTDLSIYVAKNRQNIENCPIIATITVYDYIMYPKIVPIFIYKIIVMTLLCINLPNPNNMPTCRKIDR